MVKNNVSKGNSCRAKVLLFLHHRGQRKFPCAPPPPLGLAMFRPFYLRLRRRENVMRVMRCCLSLQISLYSDLVSFLHHSAKVWAMILYQGREDLLFPHHFTLPPSLTFPQIYVLELYPNHPKNNRKGYNLHMVAYYICPLISTVIEGIHIFPV